MTKDLKLEPAANRSKRVRNALTLAPLALFPFLLLGVLFVFRGSSQKRAVADRAIYMAQASPQVAAEIGLPIEPGWPIRGLVQQYGAYGMADLHVRLRGSRGSGTLDERAARGENKWRICSLTFTPDGGGASLDLLPQREAHCTWGTTPR